MSRAAGSDSKTPARSGFRRLRSPTAANGSAAPTRWIWPARGCWPARWPVTVWRANARSLIDDSSIDADLYKIIGIDDPATLTWKSCGRPRRPALHSRTIRGAQKWLQFRSASIRPGRRSTSTSRRPMKAAWATTWSSRAQPVRVSHRFHHFDPVGGPTHSPETLVFAFFDFKG